jgi:uncharacterized membrane protein YfcA
MFELLIFGVLTGLVSGFFGVGGGMVLIPLLLVRQYTDTILTAWLQVFSNTFVQAMQ